MGAVRPDSRVCSRNMRAVWRMPHQAWRPRYRDNLPEPRSGRYWLPHTLPHLNNKETAPQVCFWHFWAIRSCGGKAINAPKPPQRNRRRRANLWKKVEVSYLCISNHKRHGQHRSQGAERHHLRGGGGILIVFCGKKHRIRRRRRCRRDAAGG